MVVKSAFRSPPGQGDCHEADRSAEHEQGAIPPLALRDRVIFYVVTVSKPRPRTNGLQPDLAIAKIGYMVAIHAANTRSVM